MGERKARTYFIISIHALREEGDQKENPPQQPQSISIHALREEGDQTLVRLSPMPTYFYPRPPRGGRHSAHGMKNICGQISIHALREEGDALYDEVGRFQSDFYPRPPRGGRQALSMTTSVAGNFYPRPPRGGRL